MNLKSTLLALLLLAPIWSQQRPRIDSIANAASLYRPPQDPAQPGLGVAGGSIISIFGQNLAQSNFIPDSFPLPTQLGETSVAIGGIDAHLFFVSPNQINAMVPSAFTIRSGESRTSFNPVQVVVRVGPSVSDSYALKITGSGLGIFTMDGSGCGQGFVYQVGPDGSTDLNGPGNSARPGETVITVIGNGSAADPLTQPSVPDGEPAPLNGPRSSGPSSILAENYRSGWYANYDAPFGYYAVSGGPLPGAVATSYTTFRLPDRTPEGCAVPLRWIGGHFVSQNVTISVHRGGGQCVDPPLQSIALLTWERSVTSGLQPATVTEELRIEFVAAPGKDLPVRYIVPSFLGGDVEYVNTEGPSCPLPADTRLDGGVITAQGPDWGPVTAEPDAFHVYRFTLPPHAIHAGTFLVSGAGGSHVGPFETSLDIPAPIQPGSYPPGTRIPCCLYYSGGKYPSFSWTGGTDESWVRVGVLSRVTNVTSDQLRFNDALAGTGKLFFTVLDYAGIVPTYDAEVTFTQDAVSPVKFDAPGLSQGGLHRFVYRWRFTDVVVADGGRVR